MEQIAGGRPKCRSESAHSRAPAGRSGQPCRRVRQYRQGARTELPETATNSSARAQKLFGAEQRLIVSIVLANEFVDSFQVRAKGKGPRHRPGFVEYVGIFNR